MCFNYCLALCYALAVDGHADEGIDAEHDEQAGLHAPYQPGKGLGLGVAHGGAWPVERQAKYYTIVPGAEAAVAGYTHANAAEHEEHENSNYA